MKKLLVTTVALSLTLSPLAKAETAGQTLDAAIDSVTTQSKTLADQTVKTHSQLGETLVITPLFESELALRRAQMEAYRAARKIVSENNQTRYVVSLTGIAVVGLSSMIVANLISKIKVVSKFGKAGRLAAFLGTVAGGFFLADRTGSVLVLSEDELNAHMASTRARISQLELAK